MLLSRSYYPTILALFALLSEVYSQWTLIPRCIRDCIDSHESSNCEVSDIACLCRASSGNYLPELVTCTHNKCIDIATDILLAPLQWVCELAGASIPDSAIEAAESSAAAAGGTATQTTTTTATTGYTSIGTVTVTTTEEGKTYTVLYPVTVERTRTVTGEPSTITKATTVTYTTTQVPSSSRNPSSDPEETTATTLSSTTVLGKAITSSLTSSATKPSATKAPENKDNGSPFSDTNSPAYKGREVGNLFGLSVLIILGVLWF